MKVSKRMLSLLLCFVMLFSCATVAFAKASYSGEVTGDVTLSYGDTINDGAVFKGTVTVSSGFTVETGKFEGSVVNNGNIQGGTFTKDVTNNSSGLRSISGGTFSGTVTNNGYITDGTFSGTVINNASGTLKGILGGTYTGKVTNNGDVKGGTYKGSFVNESGGSVSLVPVFYCAVTNSGTLSGGSYGSVVNNSGTVKSGVSAIIYNSVAGTTTVQGSPSVFGNATVNQGNTFTVPSGSNITVQEGGSLNIGVTTTLIGHIYVNEKGSLSLNGNMDAASTGDINIVHGGTLSGTKKSQYSNRTFEQYLVKIQSNVELSEFDITINALYTNPTDYYLYNGKDISYSIDYSATNKGCVTVNSVTLYEGRKSDSNKMDTQTGTSATFAKTMPKSNVIIYVDCVTNHQKATRSTEPTCTTEGKTEEYCTACGHVISSVKSDALGHLFTAWSRPDNNPTALPKTRTCTRSECGYKDTAYVEIKGYESNEAVVTVQVDYKSSFTFHYNTADGYTAGWSYNNGSLITGNNTYTVTEAKDDFTITAKAMKAGIPLDSYTVKVEVKHGFFDKFVAFFRGIFGALPKYVDNVKQ